MDCKTFWLVLLNQLVFLISWRTMFLQNEYVVVEIVTCETRAYVALECIYGGYRRMALTQGYIEIQEYFEDLITFRSKGRMTHPRRPKHREFHSHKCGLHANYQSEQRDDSRWDS